MTSIRPARIEELDALHRIIRDAIRHMDEQGIPQWDEIYPSKLVLKDDVEKQQMHVIEIEGRVAGLIVLNEDQSPEYADVPWKYPGRVLVIHRLTIDPTYQQRGLATRLMDFAEEMASTENYDSIRLDAFTRNPAALTFYDGRGYRRAGIVQFRKGEFFCYEKAIDTKGAEKDSIKELKLSALKCGASR